MNTKPKLKFRVVVGHNPKTKVPLLRPLIADRETYYMDQLVDYALNAGYVRGQFHDMRGALNGFVEAMQQLGRDGKAVNLNDWLRIHGGLTGQVDETRQLTDANEYKVRITALKELKRKATDFSWTNIDDSGVIPKIDTITYDGCPDNWKIQKSAGFTATGRNLIFDAVRFGDAVKATWKEGDVEKSAELIPVGSGYSFIKFDPVAAFAAIPDGTKITLLFTLHGGIEGGAAFGPKKEVTVVPSAEPEPLVTSSDGFVKVKSIDENPIPTLDRFTIRGENVGYKSSDPDRGLPDHGLMGALATVAGQPLSWHCTAFDDDRASEATFQSDGSAEELEPGEYTAALTLNYAVDDGTGVSHLEPLVIENVKFTVSE